MLEDKQPEIIDAEQWIGKKGIAAKGKKCVDRGEVKSVSFIKSVDISLDDDEMQAEGMQEDASVESVYEGSEDDGLDILIEEPTLF